MQTLALRRSRLFTALAIALALQVPLAGCFGRFALVRKVYGFNESIGDKWLRSLLMFAMVIVPVYAVAGLVDYLVLNVIEFWSGNNPAVAALQPGQTLEKTQVAPDGTRLTITVSEQGRAMRLAVEKPGQKKQVTLLSRSEGGAEARAADGTLLARLEITEEGGALIEDGQGALVAARSAQEVAALAAAAKRSGAALAQQLEVQRAARLASAR
jgi:Domain of unknown function (DUF3332)